MRSAMSLAPSRSLAIGRTQLTIDRRLLLVYQRFAYYFPCKVASQAGGPSIWHIEMRFT